MNDRYHAPEAAVAGRHSLARIGRLMRKELTEILRDRRTILTLVLMPLLLYPLLTVAFQQYFQALQINSEYIIGFASEQEKGYFSAVLLDKVQSDLDEERSREKQEKGDKLAPVRRARNQDACQGRSGKPGARSRHRRRDSPEKLRRPAQE